MTRSIMEQFNRPTLLYDGACPMCMASVRWLHRTHLDDGVKVSSWQAVVQDVPSLANSALQEQIQREIVLVLPETHQILGGPSVLAQLLCFKKSLRWLGRLLQIQWLQAVSQWFYEAFSLNRNMLTPPKPEQVTCLCSPPEDSRVRWRLYGILLTTSVLGLIVFASALAANYQEKALDLITHLMVAMGGGWLLAYAGIYLLLRERFKSYFPQSLIVMTMGGLWLLVVGLLLGTIRLWALQTGSVLSVSFMSVLALNLHTAIMLLSTIRRTADLHFPPILPWLWLVLYFAGYLLLTRIYFVRL